MGELVAYALAATLIFLNSTRADQNKDGALLGSPMRTAMHGKSRVSSAVSVDLN